ncbi:MAG: AraC family transcriptional regulator [Terrimicrobiaceae bacterium]
MRVLSADATSPVPVDFSPEGVFVLESRHRKGFRMEKASHDFWKILLAFHGSGFLLEGSRRRPIAAGDVAVVPPGTVHGLQDSGENPLSLYGICIRTAFLKPVPTSVAFSGNLRLHQHPIWAGELAGLLRSLLIEQSRPAPGSPAWVTGLAWQIIGLVWRAEAGKRIPAPSDSGTGALARQRVAAYARELPQHFHEEMEIDEAAERLGLSRRRFTQLFREVTGGSWLQTVLALRVGHARRLLRQTNRSVAAVAFESGFQDLSHFYRVFRKSSGSSPEAWRIKNLGEAFKNMNSESSETKPKQASGYQTQGE